MNTGVSILTPTIVSRRDLLARCIASVDRVTIPHEHVIVLDDPPSGIANVWKVLEEAEARAAYDWHFLLSDDDYLLPGGLEALYQAAVNGEYDFVIGRQGEGDTNTQTIWTGTWPAPGATAAYLYHKRLLKHASWSGEGWPPGTTGSGNDYFVLRKWVEAGARHLSIPTFVLIHRVG